MGRSSNGEPSQEDVEAFANANNVSIEAARSWLRTSKGRSMLAEMRSRTGSAQQRERSTPEMTLDEIQEAWIRERAEKLCLQGDVLLKFVTIARGVRHRLSESEAALFAELSIEGLLPRRSPLSESEPLKPVKVF
jgi:hypothetical protein